MASRTYVVGLPVVLTVHDDGRVEAEVDLSEAYDVWDASTPEGQDDTDDVVTLDGVEYRARDLRPTTEPAQALTEKVRSWTLATPSMNRTNDRTVPRTLDEPAVTVALGNGSAELEWRPPAMTKAMGAGMVERHGDRPDREADEPAFTITAAEGGGSERLRWTERQPGLGGTVVQADVADRKPWCDDRPATTLATRDLVADPGANANRYNGSTKSRNDGVRVSVQEAGVLQSFPADYPWQGARTKQYQQVGNAVPPLLALAVLEAVL